MVSASYEYMIELANFLSKDLWLSIPSTASDNFIKQLALYVKANLTSKTSLIYVEQSANKNFANSNRTLELNLIKVWKSVFNDTRVKHVLASSFRAFFNNPAQYSVDDYALFDFYSVSGEIAHSIDYTSNNYNVNLTVNMSKTNILNEIRQQIYKDEIDLIYMMQIATVRVKKPLIAYDVGFHVHAPTYANRFYKTPMAGIEQNFEDLIIAALYDAKVKDLYLDFMERWYRLGGGFMFMSDLVRKVDRCTPSVSHYCGYYSTLGSLLEVPQSIPKYLAAIYWLNNTKGGLPFTSADLPVNASVPCNPTCVWGTCYQGKCVCFNGYSGTSCSTLSSKYLDCASNKTKFGMNVNGLPDWSSEVTFVDVQKRSRQWIVQKIVFANTWGDWNQSDVQLDANGYPLYLQVISNN